MTGSFAPGFVILSVVIAALASYAALDLAGRIRSAEGNTRYGWLAGGATAMGLGIWSMHFVGMLAFRLPVPIAYDLPRMLLSVAVAIGASLLALIVVSRAALGPVALVGGGFLMGAAIAGMHYIGMASMRMSAELSYRAPIVALSIVVAIVASLAALWLAFSFRGVVSVRVHRLKILSAAVMGVAIAGMHYTGMAAAHFLPRPFAAESPRFVVATDRLGGVVAIGTVVILVLAIVGSVIDRYVQSRVQYTAALKDYARDLAFEVEESRRLSAELEEINLELQRSLEDAERARRELAEEHAAYAALQTVVQRQTAKARWLEGVAETATALAHEVNNPLTTLMMNVELLEEVAPAKASESIQEILRAAHRISAVISRLSNVAEAESVPYVGSTRMIDLSQRDTP
ncbi:MAG TPA: MHYT domain-containing protein [Gemmatimonadaceae bacterium]|nr:MHYT domain-containing protein [Gemmatimonadaceae bacterium]